MALRGHVFDKQLFSSDCYALVTDTFLGKQSGIIRGCDMTNTSSLIHINEGYFIVKGRPIQEEGGSNIEVEPGNIDGLYCKLVCELDMNKNNTTTELKQVSYKIVEDATNYPVLTQEDITDSGIIYQFELAKFRRTLNGIEDFVDTRSFLNFDSIYEEVRNEIKKIEDGSVFVTEEEMREVGVAVSPTEPTTNEKVWIDITSGKIYVKNDDGVFGEFIKANINITTGVEFKTGRVINGKDEYGKEINLKGLTDKEPKYVNTGLSDVTVTDYKGRAYSSTSQRILPVSGIDIYINKAGTQVTLNITSNYSSYTEAYLTVYYLKN